jgi:hypothetical protein
LNTTPNVPPLFIVEDGEIEPFARDSLSMESLLEMIGRDRTHGFGNYSDAIRVWRWKGAGSTEELTFAVDGPPVFNEDDFASQTWRLVGPDGTVHVEVAVRIDGRT